MGAIVGEGVGRMSLEGGHLAIVFDTPVCVQSVDCARTIRAMARRTTVLGMGEMLTFPSNGHTCDGYLASADADGAAGPGVIVIQEWWGLVPHIRDVADRFAAAGFTALAPDLYHGQSSTEPDGAGKLMMALNLDQAAKDLSGAIALLQQRTGREHVGVVGYCMGGGLALFLASKRPDAVAAVAPYYGVIPWASAQPDWSAIAATIVGEYAELDDSANPEAVQALQAKLRDLGKDATLYVHPGTEHAFFNDTRPEVYDAAESAIAFDRTVELFRTSL
jgi:carboxymethylenebutenolidase